MKIISILLLISYFFISFAKAESFDVAVLRGLDKVTARVSTFEAKKK